MTKENQVSTASEGERVEVAPTYQGHQKKQTSQKQKPADRSTERRHGDEIIDTSSFADDISFYQAKLASANDG